MTWHFLCTKRHKKQTKNLGKSKSNRIGKIVSWTLGILILLIILLPFALYIPWVQNKAKDIACCYVKKKTGMDLSVGQILIKFPLDISLDQVQLLDENGDTMIVAENLTANVAVKPLLEKRFEIDGAELKNGKYRFASEDSSLVLNVDVKHSKFTGADIDLENNKINVLDGELTGGKVNLSYYPYKKQVEEPDSTKSDPWRINAKHLVLNDVDYTMDMQPTIDKLTTHLARAELNDGYVDTGQNTVDAKYLSVDSLDCKYTYQSEEDAAKFNKEHPLPPEVFNPYQDTIPWTVKADSVKLTNGHAIYAKTGAKPKKGFDSDYIEVNDVNFEVKDFYNRGTNVSVPLQNLTAKERSGLEIKESHGTARINSQDIQVDDFKIKTHNSDIELDGKMDMSMLNDDPTGSMKITTSSSVDLRELGNVMPPLANATKNIPNKRPIKINGTFEGNTRDVDIKDGTIEIPGNIKANVSGNIKNITNTKKLQANVNFDANIDNAEFAKKEFLSKDVQKKVNIVPMKVKGKVNYTPGNVAGDVDMRLKSGGSLVGKGSYNLNNDSYTVDATAKSLPVKKIVPQLDINNLTAHVKGKGHGFDFLENNTAIDAEVQLKDVDYAGKHYKNLDADVKLNGTNFDAKVNAKNRGTLAAKGSYNPKNDKYDIDATMNSFPVNEFAPDLGVGPITAKVKARGEKFDFLNPNTRIDADVDLTSVQYNGQVFKDLQGNVSLDGNRFEGHIDSSNPDCDLYADLNGTINGDVYTVDLKGNVRDLDLKSLGLTDMPCDGKGNIDLQGDFNIKTKNYNADVRLTDLDWNLDGEQIFSDMTDMNIKTDNNSISAYYNDESTYINFSAPHNLDDFLNHFDKCSTIAQRQYKDMNLNINEVCDALPQFDMDVKMGPNGLIQRVLGKWDIDFRDVKAQLHNDSTLNGQIYANTLSKGNTAIDTLSLNIDENNRVISFGGHMGNRKGTWDEMAKVDLEGYATGSQFNVMVDHKNIKNETGYHLGLNANLQDSILDVNILPKQPVIAYRKWNINDNNYVMMDLDEKRIEADLKLESDSSLITLHTAPLRKGEKQNILVDIDNLRIEEWTNMIPSLTSMTGVLNADMALSYDGHNLEGDGNVALSKFTYNGLNQGDLKMKTKLSLDPSTSATQLTANFDIDGSNVAVAYGSLNDTTAMTPLNLSVNLDRFPLSKVSPFIPGRMVWLNGYANGQMVVNGTMEDPIMNGYLVSDSAFVKLPRYGSSLRLSEEKISVIDNTIAFKDYKIYGLNEKAALLNGDVDFKSLDNIKMNLGVSGKDIQFFGSEQKSYSEIFGKGFIDIDGKLRSSNNLIAINADVKLLPKSNITYVMQDEITNMANNNAIKGMVTFVNPNDSAWYNDSIVTGGTSASSALNMLVNLDIEKGAKINAFLQPEGKDRISVDGSGHLKYSIDFAGKDNLNGTYIINSGIVRYTPPVISQKVFNIIDGSSLTWNGDMLNPQLNLKATNSTRSSVANDNGNGSRLVDFDIIAKLDNTLNNIDLKFDLEAKNDAAIQSELQMLTDTQRSQTAINLLLYNSYSGANTTGEFSTTGALFSFLQSQINSWAANNLKGFDVSFGINQYQGTLEDGARTQTSYSYRLSKSLFGDRFKIAVGGEYSTEASREQNFSNNLINDISIEYLLNPSGTRYLRLFRHKSIESVLEGEVTVTGISFVMKHKVASFKDLFKWLKKTPKLELPQNIMTPNDSINTKPAEETTNQPVEQ